MLFRSKVGGEVLPSRYDGDHARGRLRDLVGVPNAERSLQQAEDLRAPDRYVPLRLDDGKLLVKILDRLRALDLRRPDSMQTVRDHDRKVVTPELGVQSVDADGDLAVSELATFQDLAYQNAGGVLLARRDRILEIEDEAVRSEEMAAGEHVGVVSRQIKHRSSHLEAPPVKRR